MFPATKVYPITDVRISGLSHADQVARLIQGGAKLIQLREKHLPPRDFFLQAEAAIKVARAHKALIVINDRVDLTLALKADGVHLGQDDLPVEAARAILGEKALIGYSTHNLAQALGARTLPIDYLAVGPIYGTSSKNDSHPTVGLESLLEIRGLVPDLALVAIGGITAENVQTTLRAGASCVAVISAVLRKAAEISAAMGDLIAHSDPTPK
jgi:thiamine-phosphate pyrophosphorylase